MGSLAAFVRKKMCSRSAGCVHGAAVCIYKSLRGFFILKKQMRGSFFLTLVVIVDLDHGLCEVFRLDDFKKRGEKGGDLTKQNDSRGRRMFRTSRIREQDDTDGTSRSYTCDARSPRPTSAALSRLVLRGRHGAARPRAQGGGRAMSLGESIPCGGCEAPGHT